MKMCFLYVVARGSELERESRDLAMCNSCCPNLELGEQGVREAISKEK
jgi:hypothetical protein